MRNRYRHSRQGCESWRRLLLTAILEKRDIVLQAVNDSGAQEFVWEGVIPFG